MAIKTLAPATVSAANTATRITAGQSDATLRVMATWLRIQADKDNVNTVYIGDSNVATSTTDRGLILSVTDGDAFPSYVDMPIGQVNLADIYFASSDPNGKVSVVYMSV